MSLSDRIRWMVVVACVALSGVALGLIVSGGRSVDRAIRIEPALVEPTETPVENSKAKAVFTLVNGTSLTCHPTPGFGVCTGWVGVAGSRCARVPGGWSTGNCEFLNSSVTMPCPEPPPAMRTLS